MYGFLSLYNKINHPTNAASRNVICGTTGTTALTID